MQNWNETAVTSGLAYSRRNAVTGNDLWIFDFMRNCFGYATILVPGFLLVRYYQRKKESKYKYFLRF